MNSEDIFCRLAEVLPSWYAAHRRDLPWRADRDPYHIWLSEIMLQQTRVEAVKGYYTRFLDCIPTIEALAGADDDVLHKLWEGLGYYSRVRNLKKAAGVICREHGGQFPREYPRVRALPGIGDYTAGAICSIAFDEKTPAVDGNVLRVVSRLTDDATPIDLPVFKKHVTASLAAVYPEDAGTFTQALMELGATVCGPNRAPDCNACPCRKFCLGAVRGTAASLPVKRPKPLRRVEEKTVFILSCGDYYALEKRPNTGLLASLWQFPNVEGKHEITEAIALVEKKGIYPTEIKRQVERKHIFTHVLWDMRGVYMEVSGKVGAYTWLSRDQILRDAALPTAFRLFWEEIEDV